MGRHNVECDKKKHAEQSLSHNIIFLRNFIVVLIIWEDNYRRRGGL
jgi:hypothetical protein